MPINLFHRLTGTLKSFQVLNSSLSLQMFLFYPCYHLSSLSSSSRQQSFFQHQDHHLFCLLHYPTKLILVLQSRHLLLFLHHQSQSVQGGQKKKCQSLFDQLKSKENKSSQKFSPQTYHFEVPSVIEHEILRFKITMHDLILLQIL